MHPSCLAALMLAVLVLLANAHGAPAQLANVAGDAVEVVVGATGHFSAASPSRHTPQTRTGSRQHNSLFRQLALPAEQVPDSKYTSLAEVLDVSIPAANAQSRTHEKKLSWNASASPAITARTASATFPVISATPGGPAHKPTLLARAFSTVMCRAAQFYPGPAAENANEGDPHPFWKFQWDLVWQRHVLMCSVILFFSGVLCSAAGIGGGGIYVAALMVSGQLSPHDAVPLSKAIVFFGSIASLIVNLGLNGLMGRGEARQSVIDMDAIRIVVPGLLAGTLVGVRLNWYTSDAFIAGALSLILTFMTFMVLRTAYSQYQEETSGLADQPVANPQDDEPSLVQPQDPQEDSSSSDRMKPNRLDVIAGVGLLFCVAYGGSLRTYMHVCREEIETHTPHVWCRQRVAIILFGGNLERWMSRERLSQFLQLMAMYVPIWCCGALSAYCAVLSCSLPNWTLSRVLAYQAVAVVTGILAGLVGVGGGLILSPFFLLTGIDPFISVSTSATCVIFTSASTTIQYAMTNRVISSLAVVYGIVTVLASYAGTSLIHLFRDRFAGRRSYITLIVAASVLLSAILAFGKLVALIHQDTSAGASEAM